jgi:hypothetical protein
VPLGPVLFIAICGMDLSEHLSTQSIAGSAEHDCALFSAAVARADDGQEETVQGRPLSGLEADVVLCGPGERGLETGQPQGGESSPHLQEVLWARGGPLFTFCIQF